MASSWHTELFGPTLASREGPVPTDKALEDAELVAILFGASWCPACQAFFPTLSRFYERLAEQNPNHLKIVYSTADTAQDTFDTTMSKTAWFAIPFDGKKIRTALGRKFAVAGVPCLLVLDNATGEPKVMNARRTVEDSVDNEEDPLAVFEQWQKMNVRVESGCVACSIL